MPASSDYIVDENITLLGTRRGTQYALDFVDEALVSKALHLVWLDTAGFQEAANVLKANDDKRWSFTDWTSFAIMRQLGVREAFAFDTNCERQALPGYPNPRQYDHSPAEAPALEARP